MSYSPYLNIDIATQPAQSPLPVVANCLFFSIEKPFNEPFRAYASSQMVAEDFGSEAEITKMSEVVFAQSRSLTRSGGVLYIAPLENSLSATRGTFKTADISGNLENFKTGGLKKCLFEIDGVDVEISNIDFSKANSFNDIIFILQNLKDLPLADVNLDFVNNEFIATSKTYGTTSSVLIKTFAGGTGIDLEGEDYFDIANSTATTGGNATGETIAQALARVDGLSNAPFFVNFATNLKMEKDVVKALAGTVEAGKSKIFWHSERARKNLNLGIATSLNSELLALKYKHTRIVADIYIKNEDYPHIGAMSKLAGMNFDEPNGHTDLFHKGLVGVRPSDIIKVIGLIDLGVISRYVAPGVFLDAKIDGVSSGDLFGLIWLQATVRSRIFSLQTTTTTKIPQTEEGVQLIKNQIIDVLQQAVLNRFIAPNVWTGEKPVAGSEEQAFIDSIASNGFYITSNPIANQPQADREQGKAPLISFFIKLAGAIISITVLGTAQS